MWETNIVHCYHMTLQIQAQHGVQYKLYNTPQRTNLGLRSRRPRPLPPALSPDEEGLGT